MYVLSELTWHCILWNLTLYQLVWDYRMQYGYDELIAKLNNFQKMLILGKTFVTIVFQFWKPWNVQNSPDTSYLKCRGPCMEGNKRLKLLIWVIIHVNNSTEEYCKGLLYMQIESNHNDLLRDWHFHCFDTLFEQPHHNNTYYICTYMDSVSLTRKKILDSCFMTCNFGEVYLSSELCSPKVIFLFATKRQHEFMSNFFLPIF